MTILDRLRAASAADLPAPSPAFLHTGDHGSPDPDPGAWGAYPGDAYEPPTPPQPSILALAHSSPEISPQVMQAHLDNIARANATPPPSQGLTCSLRLNPHTGIITAATQRDLSMLLENLGTEIRCHLTF
jgi:hypothetical protein